MHGSPQALRTLEAQKAEASVSRREAVDALDAWLRTELSTWNNEMLAGRREYAAFAAAVQPLLLDLESPRAFSVTECRRLLVMLGMVGSSLERHSQETGARPGVALRGLRAGSLSFRRYLAALASRVGSPPRDSFMSYVLWNMPAAAVYLPGEREAALEVPGVFGASPPFMFTANAGELLFLTLLKRCAALEEIANRQLVPICDGTLAPDDPTAVANIERAGLLLRSVRAEMRTFMGRPEFTPELMLDDFRQYACEWDEIDAFAAPSGAHDPAYVARDLMLGTPIPGFEQHVDALFGVIGPAGRQEILEAQRTVPLDQRIRSTANVSDLRTLEPEAAASLVADKPWLLAYARLYQANAAVSATHWAMIMKYMVMPMRQRDHDAVVVSNHTGTTYMWMDTLRTYMEARTDHPLAGLKHLARSTEGLDALRDGSVRAVVPSTPIDQPEPGTADAAVQAVYEMAAMHNSGDLEGTRRFYTDDVEWHVQGQNETVGDFAGIDALFEYFARSQHLTENTLKLHPQTVTVSGDLVGVLMRVTAERPDGRVMDTLLAQTRRLADDGRWCEYWAAADDQDALDAFWA